MMDLRDIENVVTGLRAMACSRPTHLRCHPGVFAELKAHVVQDEQFAMLGTQAGIDIIVDADLRPREWKLTRDIDVIAWFIPTDETLGILYRPNTPQQWSP